MRFLMFLISTIFLAVPGQAQAVQAPDGLAAAFRNAGMSKENSLNENIRLSLNYIQSDYPQRLEEVKKIQSLIAVNNKAGLKKLLGDQWPERLMNEPLNQLHGDLDMARRLSEALNLHGKIVGFGCRTRALLMGNLLGKAGIHRDKIFIAESITEDTFRLTCSHPGQNASNRNDVDLGGHVFLILQDQNGTWRLFNPSYPFDSEFNLKGKGFPFLSPEDVKKAAAPVMIPPDANPYLNEHGNLVIYSTSPADQSPNYKLSQRINMVASGNPTRSICSKALPEKTASKKSPEKGMK